MKRLFTVFLTVILANVAIQSKAAGNPEIERKAKGQVAQMSQRLALTKDQEAKLLPIYVDALTEKEALQNKKQSEPEKRAALAELKKSTDAKVQAVLTAEQYTKWQNAKKERQTQKANRTK